MRACSCIDGDVKKIITISLIGKAENSTTVTFEIHSRQLEKISYKALNQIKGETAENIGDDGQSAGDLRFKL